MNPDWNELGHMEDSGIVFNIQKYSLHDGLGIRTVVFLKGCGLRCAWCSNPESHKPLPQLAYNRNKCLSFEACGRCLKVCPTGAVKRGAESRIQIERKSCTECLACARVCPARALNVLGERMRANQVIDQVEEDSLFYSRSGGGLTLSGGEPMDQPEFSLSLLKEAKRRRINTAMETCGLCRWPPLKSACGHLDHLLYDVKTMDSKKHRIFTGHPNQVILKNLASVRENFPDLPISVRTPVIPGFNDRVEEIRAIAGHICAMAKMCYEVLPYHRMGKSKYEYLGLTYPMEGNEKLNESAMGGIQTMLRSEFTNLISERGRPLALTAKQL